MLWLSLAALLVLVAVHVLAGRLRFLEGTPRTVALSTGAGVSVAYVFVHLLHELGEFHEKLREAQLSAWVLALLGFVTFYGLERLALSSRDREESGRVGGLAFWTHAGTFALYNAVIGYLLRREGRGPTDLVLFTVAMALHFMVNDFGLRDHYHTAYDRIGRWLFAGGLCAGFALGSATRLSEATVGAAIALLGGGVVLNVIKEELPRERQSRFWAFAAGAAAYTALLLAI